MPTSPEEQKDLDEMKAKQAKIRDDAFSMLRMALRWDKREMETSGYGRYTKDEMIRKMVERYIADVDKCVVDHIKKWPDD